MGWISISTRYLVYITPSFTDVELARCSTTPLSTQCLDELVTDPIPIWCDKPFRTTKCSLTFARSYRACEGIKRLLTNTVKLQPNSAPPGYRIQGP